MGMSVVVLNDWLQPSFPDSTFLKSAVEQYRLREEGGIKGVKDEVSQTVTDHLALI